MPPETPKFQKGSGTSPPVLQMRIPPCPSRCMKPLISSPPPKGQEREFPLLWSPAYSGNISCCFVTLKSSACIFHGRCCPLNSTPAVNPARRGGVWGRYSGHPASVPQLQNVGLGPFSQVLQPNLQGYPMCACSGMLLGLCRATDFSGKEFALVLSRSRLFPCSPCGPALQVGSGLVQRDGNLPVTPQMDPVSTGSPGGSGYLLSSSRLLSYLPVHHHFWCGKAGTVLLVLVRQSWASSFCLTFIL